MRRAAVLLVPLLVIGLVGAVVAVGGRESDAAFVFRQQNPSSVSHVDLERLIAKAREPVAGGHGSRTLGVRCTPGSKSERRNPWTCVVRYASGRVTHYRVEVDPRGAYQGVDPTGERLINGCCVAGGTSASG